jgi:hypothetical protein
VAGRLRQQPVHRCVFEREGGVCSHVWRWHCSEQEDVLVVAKVFLAAGLDGHVSWTGTQK